MTDVVRAAAHPLTGAVTDYDPLMSLIGEARFVLIGEASHGTHEFYRERAIGVIYPLETERQSHYFYARLPGRHALILSRKLVLPPRASFTCTSGRRRTRRVAFTFLSPLNAGRLRVRV
jgi:hypothetical protein